MPLPAISVVIPHLNQPLALETCLGALAAQRDAPAFEVLVVDNGSRELPRAVCAGFPFVRLLSEAEPGPGPARSQGARQARGEILAFIDADCRPEAGWLAAISGFLSTNPQIGVIGGDVRIRCRQPGKVTAIEAYESIWGYRMPLYIGRDHYTATCNMAVRRPVFLKVGDFAGITIAEDVDWGRRAHAAGHAMAYLPEMAVTTPARESFAELARKWRRHIGHDYAEGPGRWRWLARALALAASPLAELPNVLTSDQVQGPRERLLALLCLIRVRLYRARVMLGLLFGGDGHSLAEGWRGQK